MHGLLHVLMAKEQPALVAEWKRGLKQKPRSLSQVQAGRRDQHLSEGPW